MASQILTNPYKLSDTEKRYQTFDYYTKHTFGGKCAKLPLDAGFTCPNKDGTVGTGGCIYCLSGSSASRGESLAEQYENARRVVCRKWSPVGFIPYLQANTNTYADAATLRRIYDEAASLEGAVMLDVATRADCLSDAAVAELVRVSQRIPVTVELGLQSSSDKTAEAIGRGHDFAEFCRGYERLRAAGGNISVGIHIINGLPTETHEDMLRTAKDVARLAPELVKLHLMLVLRSTRLCELYLDGSYVPLEREEYVRTVCDQIELLPPRCVIARVTGDSPTDCLVAPMWSRRKIEIMNMIDRELYLRGTYQGIYYNGD